MLKAEKKEFVNELHDIYQQVDSIIITHYHGITVGQMTDLRNSLRDSGAKLKVVKNTLSKLAINKTNLNPVSSMLSGPVAIVYSQNAENSIEAVKKIVEFSNSNKNLRIIGGMLGNNIINDQELQQIAKLPSLNILRGKIIGLLQASAVNIVSVLQAPSVKIVKIIQSYSEKN